MGRSKGVVAFTLLDWDSGRVWGQGGPQPDLGFERGPSSRREESRLEGRKGRNRERGLGTVSGRVQSGLGSVVAREGGAGMVSDAGCFQGGADRCVDGLPVRQERKKSLGQLWSFQLEKPRPCPPTPTPAVRCCTKD